MFRSAPEYEADISALANCLRAVPIGESVTYTTLDAAIGRSCRAQRYLLERAREIVEKEDGALFESVFKVGLKRLPVDDYHQVGSRARSLIRRRARRASKRMGNGIEKANDVSPEALRAYHREATVLGLIQHAARDNSLRKRMENEPADAPTPLAHAARLLLQALGSQS